MPRLVGPEGLRADPSSAAEATPTEGPAQPANAQPASPFPGLPLEGFGVVGITRRRVVWLLAAILATWVVIVFARQVGEASTASAQASRIENDNAQLAANVAALQRELDTIQQEPFVMQEARANGLGRPNERPFRLAPGASPLPPDAPGSAITRLGSIGHRQTPLESWLSLLFGPATSSN
jgi:cell division protein FtsB